VRAQRGADPLEHGAVVGQRIESGMEGLRPLAGHLPEELGLRVDVGVERALLETEGLREVADRRAVVALLREEPGGGAG
jgi:hypothetical protein